MAIQCCWYIIKSLFYSHNTIFVHLFYRIKYNFGNLFFPLSCDTWVFCNLGVVYLLIKVASGKIILDSRNYQLYKYIILMLARLFNFLLQKTHDRFYRDGFPFGTCYNFDGNLGLNLHEIVLVWIFSAFLQTLSDF